MWRWAVMTMWRVTEVNEGVIGLPLAKQGRAQGAWSKQHRGVSHNLWSDRQSLKSACGLRVCRPLRAVRRRLLEVSAAVAIVAGVEKVHRRTAHRAWGGVNAEGVECRRQLPLWVGGTWLTVWLRRDWSLERSDPALTSRKSKRRFRVALELERTDTVGSPEVSVRQAEMETRR